MYTNKKEEETIDVGDYLEVWTVSGWWKRAGMLVTRQEQEQNRLGCCKDREQFNWPQFGEWPDILHRLPHALHLKLFVRSSNWAIHAVQCVPLAPTTTAFPFLRNCAVPWNPDLHKQSILLQVLQSSTAASLICICCGSSDPWKMFTFVRRPTASSTSPPARFFQDPLSRTSSRISDRENCGFVFAKQSFFTKKMDVVLWLSATPCRVGKRASGRLVACAGGGGASSADDDGDEAAAAPPEVDLSVMSFTLGTLLFLLELFLSS